MAAMDLVSYNVWLNLWHTLYYAYHDTAWPSIFRYMPVCDSWVKRWAKCRVWMRKLCAYHSCSCTLCSVDALWSLWGLFSMMTHRILQRFTLVTGFNVGSLESFLVLAIHCAALYVGYKTRLFTLEIHIISIRMLLFFSFWKRKLEICKRCVNFMVDGCHTVQ